ncbi:hypothetical protein IHQ68_11485 [Chelatococcus sambhunathii]|uniref:DUF1795 domain-containing protein n=1 Tax=Chelatococcus sambhunathii TaxID=363953 RepID=A0ABU1DGJ1_9HYPH|nr:hypothetical protein [Chelatococcus sambhunathii]MDR4307241.1 hypothetical protein [Chelatococcus sambhunathii]
MDRVVILSRGLNGDFCKFAWLFIALGLLASPAQAEIVKNKEFRFSLAKPNGWQNLSFEAYRRRIDREIVSSEDKKRFISSVRRPIIALSKFKEPYDGLNSTFLITVSRNDKLLGQPIKDIGDAFILAMSRTLSTISVYSTPKEINIGGIPAVCVGFYTEGSLTSGHYRVANEMCVVPRDGRFLLIGIQTEHNDRATLAALRSAVGSLRFER